MPELPGTTVVTTPLPPLPGSQPQGTAIQVPSWWDEPKRVIEQVFAISLVDPKAAASLWNEYQRLRSR